LTFEQRKRRSRSSPSEKARFHYRMHLSALSVGKEMSLRDPHYRPRDDQHQNPFATLPRLREGKKIVGGGDKDLFSSCFELPSPSRGPTPTGSPLAIEQQDLGFDYSEAQNHVRSLTLTQKVIFSAYFVFSSIQISSTHSLPPSPTRSDPFGSFSFNDDDFDLDDTTTLASSRAASNSTMQKSTSSSSRFEDHLFQGRVQLLKRLYSGGSWVTQDDTLLRSPQSPSSTFSVPGYFPLRRRGSCESGFFSSVSTAQTATSAGAAASSFPMGISADDFFLDSELSSTRSLGSSLLTVSDLEEDLRAASAFLSSASTSGATKRTSSIFTDSTDDLSSLAGASDEATTISGIGMRTKTKEFGYEKDIRDIVEYFEASCGIDNVGRSRENSKVQLLFAARAAAAMEQPSSSSSSGSHQPAALQRSQKIERLIKRVVEKESRDRLRKTSVPSAAGASAGMAGTTQVCDGIVRSKLPIFDASKRPLNRAMMMKTPYDQKGFVKSKLALFDGTAAAATADCASTKKMAERRLADLMTRHQEKK
jgi:hypothetical protein